MMTARLGPHKERRDAQCDDRFRRLSSGGSIEKNVSGLSGRWPLEQ
jgi:hypothetical protein